MNSDAGRFEDKVIKVLCVFGTRPEVIKMAPVIKELRRHPEMECKVCVTAQHRQMLDQVLRLFDITPDYDPNVMKDNQSPAQVASAVLARLEPVLEKERPDWVLVQRPLPEEINRREGGVIAAPRLPPTERAHQNLLQEGVPDGCIMVTGNAAVVYQWD